MSQVRIPFGSPAPREDGAAIRAAITRVVDSGWYVLGPEVAAFEAAFAAAIGTRHAVGVGTGTDAIRVAMIYKPARVAPQGSPVSDIDDINNRPPLAQTFAALNGEAFTVVVNHFKSKGSCPASGDAEIGRAHV